MVLHSPEVSDDTPIPPESLFLGSLRSELDVPSTLPPNFTRFKDTYVLLMQIYRDGLITAEQLADQLARLKCFDAGSGEWTIGGSSGKWYRRLSGRWVVSGPPLTIAGDAALGPWEQVEAHVHQLSGTPYTSPVAIAEAAPAETDSAHDPDDLTDYFMAAPAVQATLPPPPAVASAPTQVPPPAVVTPPPSSTAETPPLPPVDVPPPPPPPAQATPTPSVPLPDQAQPAQAPLRAAPEPPAPLPTAAPPSSVPEPAADDLFEFFLPASGPTDDSAPPADSAPPQPTDSTPPLDSTPPPASAPPLLYEDPDDDLLGLAKPRHQV